MSDVTIWIEWKDPRTDAMYRIETSSGSDELTLRCTIEDAEPGPFVGLTRPAATWLRWRLDKFLEEANAP